MQSSASPATAFHWKLAVLMLLTSRFAIFLVSCMSSVLLPLTNLFHIAGLIASAGRGGNMNDVKLVESLVTSYIKKPSCIILLTVACES